MLAVPVSKRDPLNFSMRVRCTASQRARWRKAGKRTKRDESAVVRQLMDEWADQVLNPQPPQEKPEKQ